MKKIIINIPSTGNCLIDIDRLVKKWNALFWISQYDDKFRLIKYKQKNSPITTIKVQLSAVQAKEVIDRLKLTKTPDAIFRRSASWRIPNNKEDNTNTLK